MVSKSNSSK